MRLEFIFSITFLLLFANVSANLGQQGFFEYCIGEHGPKQPTADDHAISHQSRSKLTSTPPQISQSADSRSTSRRSSNSLTSSHKSFAGSRPLVARALSHPRPLARSPATTSPSDSRSSIARSETSARAVLTHSPSVTRRPDISVSVKAVRPTTAKTAAAKGAPKSKYKSAEVKPITETDHPLEEKKCKSGFWPFRKLRCAVKKVYKITKNFLKNSALVEHTIDVVRGKIKPRPDRSHNGYVRIPE